MYFPIHSIYYNFIQLVPCRHRFADKQIVRVQETPDEIPEGGTPHTVSLLMHDKLVDAGKPGDRVEVRLYVIYCFLLILYISPTSGSFFYVNT